MQNNGVRRSRWCLGSICDGLDAWFLIKQRDSSIWTEFRAGFATFLTMSYILLVNPQILGRAGLPPNTVGVATALGSAVGSITSGLMSNLPCGLAPGTGLSVYMAYGLVLGGAVTMTQALTASFLSGVLLAICSFTGIAALIMRITPRTVKLAIVVGMGLLIALIGLVSVGIVVHNNDTIVGLGHMDNVRMWAALGGIVLAGSLIVHHVPGAVLLSIIISTVIEFSITDDWPSQVVHVPEFSLGPSELINLSDVTIHMLPAIIAFLFVGIFDVSGVMFGMANLAGISDPEYGTVPGSLWGFVGSALGTIVAASFGCSPIIIHVESAAGIKEGGRTGLTAVFVGIFFLGSLFFAPLFSKVPATATAPILVVVGAMMMGEAKRIDWNSMEQSLPAFLTLAMMPFSFSIPNGILFGLGTSISFFFTTGEFLDYLKPFLRRVFCCPREDEESLERQPLLGNNGSGTPSSEYVKSSPSFFDEGQLARRPGLLLTPRELETFDSETAELDQNRRSASALARTINS